MWLNILKFCILGILLSLRKEVVGLIKITYFNGLWSEWDGVLLDLNANIESKILTSFEDIHCAFEYIVIHLPSLYLNVKRKVSQI